MVMCIRVHSACFQAEKGANETEQDKKCSQGPCVPKMTLSYHSNDRTCER